MSTMGVIPRLKAHIPNNPNHSDIHQEHSVQNSAYPEFARILEDSSNDLHSISVTPLDHHHTNYYQRVYTGNPSYTDISQQQMSSNLPHLIPPHSPQSLASPQKYHPTISPQISSPQKYTSIPASPQSHQQHQNLLHQASPIKQPYTIHHSPQQINNSPHKFNIIPVNESPSKYGMQTNISPQQTSPQKLQPLHPPQMSPQSLPYHHPSPAAPQSHPSPHANLHHHNNNYHTSPLPSLTPASNLSHFQTYTPAGYVNAMNPVQQPQQISEPEPPMLDERYDPYGLGMTQLTPGALVSGMGGSGLSESNYSASVSSDDGSSNKKKKNAPTLSTGRRNLKLETVDEDEAVRRLKRRERNRKSAQKCRERKLILTKELKTQVDQLKQDQNYVVMELNQLIGEAKQLYELFQTRCNHNIELPFLACLTEALSSAGNYSSTQSEPSYQSPNENSIVTGRPELLYINDNRDTVDINGRLQSMGPPSHMTNLSHPLDPGQLHLEPPNLLPSSQHLNWVNSYPTMTTSSSSGSQLSPPDLDFKIEQTLSQEFN